MKFYYIDNLSKRQLGPYTLDELVSKDITPETIVWRSGMKNWDLAKNVPELDILFTPPTPPATVVQNKKQINQSVKKNNDEESQEERLPMPKTWLTEPILITLFCCLPLGIPAIIYATDVSSKYNAGNYEGALKASQNAKSWINTTLKITLVLYIIYLFMSFLIGFAVA